MKKPNRYHQERDFLLYKARTASSPKPRNQHQPITPTNYAAVYTSPSNNSAPAYGPCLIWRHGLNHDGYGVTSQDGRQVLAHRAAYEISRGSIPPNTPILHMCNRRSCIQPAHLYAGTPQDNADDIKAKTEYSTNMSISFMLSRLDKHSRLVEECAPYVWPEPPHTQLSHAPEPKHECHFTVPYTPDFPQWLLLSHPREGFLCETCYRPPPGTSMWWFLLETNGHLDHQKTEQQKRQQYLKLSDSWLLRLPETSYSPSEKTSN